MERGIPAGQNYPLGRLIPNQARAGHLCGMRRSGLLLLLMPFALWAQNRVNGPMVGHCDLMEATVWMQCKGPCKARIDYWPLADTSEVTSTAELVSEARQAHAMDHVLGPLVPGTTYAYRVVLDGEPQTDMGPLQFSTQPLWKHRSDPPPFTLAMGSCAYINEPAYDRPGRPYGNSYAIFDAIADVDPDLMLWLGDNVYLREPDWGTRSGFLHRYTHTRSTPELQRLLRSTVHYATWDDHDFGPNDADGSFVNSPLAREVFDLFWPNPTNGVPGVEGITSSFSYLDVDVFLMDDRTFRVPAGMSTAQPQLFGKAQMDWLVQALKYSDASFKLVAVGSQVLNTGAVYENFATMPDERRELLQRLEQEGITGVVFLTGDRHFTELSEMTLGNGIHVWDLTSSPLTSGTYTPKEENALRVPGTLLSQHSFATLSFAGPKGARVMTMRAHDAEGKVLWERAVDQPKKP